MSSGVQFHVGLVAFFGFPVLAILFAWLMQPRGARGPRQFPALLLSTLWTLPTLLIVQRLNQHFRWWSFVDAGPLFVGMPVDLYLGWTLLWGLTPLLVFPSLGITEIAVVYAALDVWLMPLLFRVSLQPLWQIGELVALALVLLPALLLGRATVQNSRLALRATLQVALSGMLFLYLQPEVVFALRPVAARVPHLAWAARTELTGWQSLLGTPHLLLQIALQLLLLLAVPGISAVQEFAQRGEGTPIPYDPPLRLVTSGVYRYCANPMQLSCTLVMLGWALLLRSAWLGAATIVTVVYSAGVAAWDEHHDLALRFGSAWHAYRADVRAWRVRWRPYHAGPPARLYIAATCAPCTQLRRWLEARRPVGLLFLDAEMLPARSIARLRYDPGGCGDAEEGVAALARALAHCNAARAYCGCTLRLPGARIAFQLLLDACGFGPRTVAPVCLH
jgi:protein-S-isoprenylcysteine O-methyltransferase Ste14